MKGYDELYIDDFNAAFGDVKYKEKTKFQHKITV